MKLDWLFLMKDEPETEQGPSWKFRRKLIYAGFRLGVAMIVFGAITVLVDQFGVGVALITGGVSLISIVLTAYTAAATWQDTKIYQQDENGEP